MTFKDVILQICSEMSESTVKEIEPDVLTEMVNLYPKFKLDQELSDKDAKELLSLFHSQLPAMKVWFGEGDGEDRGKVQ